MQWDGHPLRDVMPLAEAFGAGLKRLRTEEGLTLDRVATTATAQGLKWSTARVLEFERGKIPITLPTLMRLGTTMTILCERDIRLSDLLGWDRWIEMPGDVGYIHAEAFRRAFNGGVVDLRYGDEIEWQRDLSGDAGALLPGVPPGVTLADLRVAHESAGLADERAAKRLGMTLDEFLGFALPCLGTSLSAYRDSNLDFDANAQERGQFTRLVVDFIGNFAERYRRDDPDALFAMERWLKDRGTASLWMPPASLDPKIRAKLLPHRLKRIERAREHGFDFTAYGIDRLDPVRAADEGWHSVPPSLWNEILEERLRLTDERFHDG